MDAFPTPNGATTFPRITIVGVVADFRQNGLDRDFNAEVFVPHAQAGGAPPETASSMYVVARTVGKPIYAAVSLKLLVVAGVACGVPALRATRLDPAAALRNEQGRALTAAG